MVENIEFVDFHIRIPKELKKQIKILCIDKDVTMQDWALEIFEEYLKK